MISFSPTYSGLLTSAGCSVEPVRGGGGGGGVKVNGDGGATSRISPTLSGAVESLVGSVDNCS